MSFLSVPEPWHPSRQKRQREGLLQGLWQYRSEILQNWPMLPIPTLDPVHADAFTDCSPPGHGPEIAAGALIMLWENSGWFRSPCHACGGDMLTIAFQGDDSGGVMSGVCIDCLALGSRETEGLPMVQHRVHGLLAGTPFSLSLDSGHFRLGGGAPSLRSVLSELGAAGRLGDTMLIRPPAKARAVRRPRVRQEEDEDLTPEAQQESSPVPAKVIAATLALLGGGLVPKRRETAREALEGWLESNWGECVAAGGGDDMLHVAHPLYFLDLFTDQVLKGETGQRVTDAARLRWIRYHLEEVLTGQGDADRYPVKFLLELHLPLVGWVWFVRSVRGYSFTDIWVRWSGPYQSRYAALTELRERIGILSVDELKQSCREELLEWWGEEER